MPLQRCHHRRSAGYESRSDLYDQTLVPKWLQLPLPAALDSRGLPLKPGPRSWGNTFVAKSKVGNLLIFQRQGKPVTPLYVLKTSVYIPARLGMADTIKTGMGLFTDRAMSSMIKGMKNAP